jgi:hypothetical protein
MMNSVLHVRLVNCGGRATFSMNVIAKTLLLMPLRLLLLRRRRLLPLPPPLSS